MPPRPGTKLDRTLGARLRLARNRKGWTQAELSVRLDVQSETISRYEAGTVPLSLETLYRAAKVLDVGIEDLLILPPSEGRLCSDENDVIRWWRSLNADTQAVFLELFRRAVTTPRGGKAPALAQDSPKPVRSK